MWEYCCDEHAVDADTEVCLWHTDLQLNGNTVGVPGVSPILNPLLNLAVFNFNVFKVSQTPSTIGVVSLVSGIMPCTGTVAGS